MLYIIALFIAGLCLIFCEFFLPGLVVGLTGIGCIVASIILSFKMYPDYGAYVLLVELVIGTILVITGFRVLPHTSIGRHLILSQTERSEGGFTSASMELASYVGKRGITQTPLRPAGMAFFDGSRLDVVAEGEYIDRNVEVEVTAVQGSRIVVRRAAK